MQRPHRTDAPERRASASEALTYAEDHPADAEQCQADDGPAAAHTRQQVADAAQKAAAQAKEHDLFWPQTIGIAPGVRAAQQRGEILQADHQPRPEGAKAHDVVNIARQYGQRQTNNEVACEVKYHNGDNAQIETHSA